MPSAIVALAVLTSVSSQIDDAKAGAYRACVVAHANHMLTSGTDHYGPVDTPLLMSIIDVATGESPQEPLPLDGYIRCEERQHRHQL